MEKSHLNKTHPVYYMQYGGDYSVWRRHIINKVEDIQMCHTISMEEVHHQYSEGYAVWTCHIINTEEGCGTLLLKLLKG